MTAAIETRYGGCLNKYFRTRYTLWGGDSIIDFDQPLPQSVPG
jgi:hypothetical protein